MNGKPPIQYQQLQRVAIKQVSINSHLCNSRQFTNHILGLYGRLDPDGWFSTTVTNVNPTAKQSKVLNPYVSSFFTPSVQILMPLSICVVV